MPVLADGFYAVKHRFGLRLIQLQTCRDKTKPFMFGKRLLFFRSSDAWKPFGFFDEEQQIKFYISFVKVCRPEQLAAMKEDIARIMVNPKQARALFRETAEYRQMLKKSAADRRYHEKDNQ